MWWLCYCVGIIVGAAARSSGDYPRDSSLYFQGTSQPQASGTRDDVNDDFVPILNSGMNILEGNNGEENKEIIPILSSGMNVDKQNDKREVNELKVDDHETTNEENNEKWFSTIPSLLDKKIEADAETASEEEVEDEINVQVKVDTAAEVSTEIRRPQITHRNGKIERRGKLKIVINVKTQKDEPKTFEGLKDSFDKAERNRSKTDGSRAH
ncbi:uncharacterized protein LOC106711726 [Papilio machaon]|uniref:uncharacterized protein LOC106711726 n=1 Tax=Papilio machaon TaxID=76193 RepID=UPI001E6649D5|nr:uncharacterized protein LOC106711726 [Papilio machaon]